MTTIGMNYEVLPGKEEEFERGFTTVLAHLSAVAGHVESHLFREVIKPGHYLILSQWSTRESFDAFLRSDEFKNVTAWGRAEILQSRPHHKVYSNA